MSDLQSFSNDLQLANKVSGILRPNLVQFETVRGRLELKARVTWQENRSGRENVPAFQPDDLMITWNEGFKKMVKKYLAIVNLIAARGRFHKHFTNSYNVPWSQKPKKTFRSSVSFCAIGIFLRKKLLVKHWWNWLLGDMFNLT